MDHAGQLQLGAQGAARAEGDAGAAVSRPDGLCVRAAVVQAVRPEQREVDFILSTETIDSYGEIVRANWDLRRFNANPVALWAHNSRDLPVGHWRNVRVESKILRGTLKIGTAAANPLCDNVLASIVEENLRGCSVGFLPHKVSFEEIDGEDVCVLDENELYETSPTPIPANPDALIDMKAMAFGAYVTERRASGLLVCTAPPWMRSVVPYEAFPPETGKWDAANALKALRKWASSDGSGETSHIDWAKYKKAFAWYDPKRAHEVGGFKLPHHQVKDGKLVTSRAGVIAAGDALMGARGGVKIPESEVAGVKNHLAKHYRQFDMKPPWEADKAAAAPRGHQESTMSTKSKVTCPGCGESFEPKDMGDDEEAKKAHAALVERAGVAERAALTNSERVKALETEGAAVKAERDAATLKAAEAATKTADVEKANAALRVKLFEKDLEPLVGVKIAPAEKDGLIEIAGIFAAQPDGDAKWKKHIDGLAARPEMRLLGAPRLGADPSPAITAGAADGSSSEAAAEINRLAMDAA